MVRACLFMSLSHYVHVALCHQCQCPCLCESLSVCLRDGGHHKFKNMKHFMMNAAHLQKNIYRPKQATKT